MRVVRLPGLRTDVDKAADSGYFVLAAIEGAKPQTQTNVGFATNARSGGNTARVIVVPQDGPFSERSADLPTLGIQPLIPLMARIETCTLLCAPRV